MHMTISAQQQSRQPGREYAMEPPPEVIQEDYLGSAKLDGKIALITGGDSGIGRSAALHLARECADIAIVYYEEETDALETKRLVEREGKECFLLKGDVGDSRFCSEAVEKTVLEYGRLNVLINNAAEQVVCDDLGEITDEQWERTFRTNIHGYFYMARAALKHLSEGDTIINVSSINPFVGNQKLVDYASTKGAINAFTRSLSEQLVGKGIRVNQIAPGPIWTPLIPATMEPGSVEGFGEDTPMGRPGQPSDVGPAFVFLASKDSSYMSGQTLHINGGMIVGS